jgi:2-methylcitrate dehydratase PrpD
MSSNLDLISAFVGGTPGRHLPAPILDAAKKCLVDWFAVSLAALADTAPSVARRQMLGWATTGRALNLYGDRGAAAPMALVNGTLSHSLDYDDMHFGSAYHASGPTMAATLAVGMDRGCTELEVLNAFATGFEVGATLGERGVGPRLAASGWHPTGVLGHFSAVCSAASLLRLAPQQIANALGLAATQAGGLQASGGSMAKPFHVGKAAMNGVMAAELAAMGMDANTALLDHPVKGVLGCLFQESLAGDLESLGRTWQLEGNTFKPYAACQLTHAPYEAAAGLAKGFRPEGLRGITVHVHPLAIEVAGRPRAATPMEGKFSIAYCVGLGLLGHGADISGFSEKRLADPDLRRLPEITRVLASDTVERSAARIELDYGDGGVRHGETTAVLGSPGRPMSWSDLDRKFLAVVEPAWGDDATHLLQTLHAFEAPGQMRKLQQLIGHHALGVTA